MEVTLIRHTSVDVPPGTCYGQTDVPLNSTFPQEAEATRQALARYQPFDAVYSSPLSRARLLAEYCGYPEPVTDQRLMEMSMGEWEMLRYDDITDPYRDTWFADYLHLPTPGGESFPMLYQRVAAFLDELKASGRQQAAVFAHGGVIVCANIYAGIVKPEEAWERQTPYGGITRIKI